jgi:DNA-binding NtrC family response regulator
MEQFDSNIYKLLQTRFGIIGDSEIMRNILTKLMQAAPTDLSVLITGDTGTGKEVFANAIHGLSNRKKYPFVSVNCGAIPETLLESELFGNEKGAFTGAVDQRIGFFESANKGTIFLDEIGEMPVGTQVKLLRILESGEFSRLGSSTLHRVDVRLIAATNRKLEERVAEGQFRQDLYFRLKSVHITLPKLSRRSEDIPQLVNFFAERICKKLQIEWRGVSPDAMMTLKTLPWHGNVRELKNTIETMITLEKAEYVNSDLLRKYIAPALPPKDVSQVSDNNALVPMTSHSGKPADLELIFHSLLDLKLEVSDLKRYLHVIAMKLNDMQEEKEKAPESHYRSEDIPLYEEESHSLLDMEKKMIVSALARHNGNRRHASNELGISERTLYRKIQEYGLE